MKLHFLKKRLIKRMTTVGFFLLGLVVSFQNCGKKDSTVDSLASSSTSTSSGGGTGTTLGGGQQGNNLCSTPDGSPCQNLGAGITDGVFKCVNGVPTCQPRVSNTTTTLGNLGGGNTTTTTLSGGGGGNTTTTTTLATCGLGTTRDLSTGQCVGESILLSTLNSANSAELNCNSVACQSSSVMYPNRQDSSITLQPGLVATFKLVKKGTDLRISKIEATKRSGGSCTTNETKLILDPLGNFNSSDLNNIPLNYFDLGLLKGTANGTYPVLSATMGCIWDIEYTATDIRDPSGATSFRARHQVTVRSCVPGETKTQRHTCPSGSIPDSPNVYTCVDGLSWQLTSTGTCERSCLINCQTR